MMIVLTAAQAANRAARTSNADVVDLVDIVDVVDDVDIRLLSSCLHVPALPRLVPGSSRHRLREASLFSTSIPCFKVSSGAAYEMRKCVVRSENTPPGMISTLFLMASATNS